MKNRQLHHFHLIASYSWTRLSHISHHLLTNNLNMGDIKESPLATRSEPPDGGWGWLVMMACLGSLTIRTGLTWAAFPVFYDDLIQYFHTSSAAIGWAGSMFTFCNFAICEYKCLVQVYTFKFIHITISFNKQCLHLIEYIWIIDNINYT